MLRFHVQICRASVCLLAMLAAGCFDKTTEVREDEPADTTASSPAQPRLTGAVLRSNTTILVSFSKPMGASVLQIGNYAIAQQTVNSEAGTLNVVAAAFDGGSSTAVMLTTRSQSDLTYRLSVTNKFDVEGNALAAASGEGNDARTTTFAGTAPRSSDLVDTDGDGLYDSEEQRGWRATILLASGERRGRGLGRLQRSARGRLGRRRAARRRGEASSICRRRSSVPRTSTWP